MKKYFQQGFTALEILIVVAIIGALVLVVLPQFSKNRELQVLKSGVQDTLSAVDKARVETLSSLNSSSYGVHFESSKVIIFKGTVFSANDANNETINIVSPASISNVTFGGVSASSGEVYFSRLSGTPNKVGTITLSTSSFSKTITIFATGVASVN